MATNVFGASVKIWLRIKEGEPDRDGYYKLVAATEESIDLPISATGCNTDKMRESIKVMHKSLK
jgi:hypothetical protein